MKKLSVVLVLLLGASVVPVMADAYPFEASVIQTGDLGAGNVFQRYYTPALSEISANCVNACATPLACEAFEGQNYCRLNFASKNAGGYRGYTENLFNFSDQPSGTVFYSIFDFERNPGAGNHQGFYSWVTGAVVVNDTSLWNSTTFDCGGTNLVACFGVANAATARSETSGVPADSGGPNLANVGGLSPIPVPKAAPGSTSSSFNLQWAPITSVGKAAGVTPAGYEVWGARRADCSSPATPAQFQFVRLVPGTSTTVNLTEVPGTGNAVTFALKIRYPSAGGTVMTTRFLSANGQCFLGGGLSADVYDLAANFAGQSNVEVTWKTSLEDGVRGFYVSRATTLDGQYARVSSLIPAKGEASSYSFIDTIQKPAGAVRATGLYYKIESIDIDDNATAFGPVKANLSGANRDLPVKKQAVERP